MCEKFHTHACGRVWDSMGQTLWNLICVSGESKTGYGSVMLFVLPRFFKSLWRSVLTSLIVRAASVTTTHCVAGVLWSTSVLGGPSVRMQWSQWDGCRTPVSASQPQSPPASLSWITLRLWVLPQYICIVSLFVYILCCSRLWQSYQDCPHCWQTRVTSVSL